MNSELLYFFENKPTEFALYEIFEKRVLAEIADVRVKVSKTQISFANKYNFAFVSFTKVRKAKDRPKAYIVVTFGLSYPVQSPRIDVATEPYPRRWTHHVLVSSPEELDDELMAWIKEAAAFSAGKR